MKSKNRMKWLLALVAALAAIALTGCRVRTVYMPFETTRLDSIHVHDTTFQWRLVPYKDSVSVKDTASFLSNPYAYSYAGWDGEMLRHSLGIWDWATVTVHVPYFIDRYIRIEVPKPYPVEKKLTRWQQLKMDFGGYAIATAVLTILVVFGKFVYKLKKGL